MQSCPWLVTPNVSHSGARLALNEGAHHSTAGADARL